MVIPVVRMNGLDADKQYRLIDLTPENEDKPCKFHGKVISGRILMEEGLSLKDVLKNEYSSLVLQIKEVK